MLFYINHSIVQSCFVAFYRKQRSFGIKPRLTACEKTIKYHKLPYKLLLVILSDKTCKCLIVVFEQHQKPAKTTLTPALSE